jgi:acyl carrier protein
MSVPDRVTAIIADQLGVPVADVTPDKTFDELGADSLAVVELVMAFEDEFEVEVEESEASELKTVKAAIDFLQKLTS